MSTPLVSVIIITAERPVLIVGCIEAIQRQTYPHYEIIVVDASRSNATEQQMHRFPGVRYARSQVANMPYQRNQGLRMAHGEMVAFIDDDALASPEWLEYLVRGYDHETVGGVGGFVEEGRWPAGTPLPPREEIGRILPNGKVASNFTVPSAGHMSVDHLTGGNMSFRKNVLVHAGGFDPTYAGTGVYEETDACLRVTASGYELIYVPEAWIKHLAAPRLGHSRHRYNLRNQYYHVRNESYFYFRNFGLRRATWNFLVRDTAEQAYADTQRIAHTLALIALNVGGKGAGAMLAIRRLFSRLRFEAATAGDTSPEPRPTGMSSPLVSVIVITDDRPELIRGCLEAVLQQAYPHFEIIVMDASDGDATATQVGELSNVRYARSRGKNLPSRRNEGIRLAQGHIVAFIDDDAVVAPGWLEHLVAAYHGDGVGAVGGYVDEGPPGEGVDQPTAGNMSFRKDVLIEAGGFDPTYTGISVRDEADACARVSAAGYQVVHAPGVRVKHLLAERRGHGLDRFNMKFQYYHARNESYFFFRTMGLRRPTWTFLVRDTSEHLYVYALRIAHAMALIAVNVYGKVVGALLAIRRMFAMQRLRSDSPDSQL